MHTVTVIAVIVNQSKAAKENTSQSKIAKTIATLSAKSG
jgi:hypothetical protein